MTYKVPADAPPDLKGRIVKAPLSGKSCYGLVVKVMAEPEMVCKKGIRSILTVYQQVAGDATIAFYQWLSDYYLMPMGVALKSSFFDEVAAAVTSRSVEHNSGTLDKAGPGCTAAPASEITDIIANAIKDRNYKAFLFHAPCASSEYALVSEVLTASAADMRGAIIIVPEIGQIEKISPALRDIFGERICVMHSKLTKKKRQEAISRIVTGRADIVLGTRSAVLAPLKSISFIAVIGEHSQAYKGEEGLRYNGRDVAVMRGFIEKSCVLLSSFCPSVESVYNAHIGKYTNLENQKTTFEVQRPGIRIVDTKRSKTKDLSISGEVITEAGKLLSREERLLFVVSRKGYSLIRCEDCGHTFRCNKCRTPLVFYKGKDTVRCHRCGYEAAAFESCCECKGFNIKPFGAGTERIIEDVEKLLNVKVPQIEKRSRNIDTIGPDVMPFVVGTSSATRKMRDAQFSSAALLNIDLLMSQPDFRAYERTFQEVTQISQMVRPDGTIFLQTWTPKNRIFKFIRNYDFHGFYEHELSQRKELGNPPFARMVLFNVHAKKESQRLLRDIQKIIEDSAFAGVEVLGPLEIPSPVKSYGQCIQILMKSKDRKQLHTAAKGLLSRLEKLKGVKTVVDVDPLRV